MDEKELKAMIESILTDMVDEKKDQKEDAKEDIKQENEQIKAPEITPTDIEDGIISDITEIDLRKQLLVSHPTDHDGYLNMKANTPARIGIGRTGTRYLTSTNLRFRADHAAAQDAVFSDVDPELVKKMDFISLKTICKSKDEFLTRPDYGRKFDEDEVKKIKDNITSHPEVQIVVGDGLSSAAIESNIENIIPALKQGLKTHDLDFEQTIFVKYCRVPAMDKIGEITDADVVCLLVGERPGLVTAESMSAYIAYKPVVGMPEARRTVVSNIHNGGTPAVEAGAYIADIIKKMLDYKASGMDLRKAEKSSE